MSNTMSITDANIYVQTTSKVPSSETDVIACQIASPKPPKPLSIKTVKLCDRCSTLGLSVDKFLIRDDRPPESKPSIRSLRLAGERFVFNVSINKKLGLRL